jgi:large subunit ribosomal protein L29
MKTLHYNELTTAELREKIADDKKLYDTMVFNHSITPLENPLKIRSSRRDIARMITELKKRNLTESK